MQFLSEILLLISCGFILWATKHTAKQTNEFKALVLEHRWYSVNRDSFMEFFRDDDDDHMGSLSVEDRIEIFRTVLTGSSDFSVKLLNEILQDYSVENIVAVDTTGMDEHILAELVE